jgi:hypothetical protein
MYKHDRFIMDEEGVRSAIEEAGCELSSVGIAEHLALAAERASDSAQTTSRPRKRAGEVCALCLPSSPAAPEFVEAQNDFASKLGRQ